MTITISLPPEKEKKLVERATAQGQDVQQYLYGLIDRDITTASTLNELLAPLRRQFAESGMTDDQLDAMVEEAREEIWQAKQARKVP